MILDDNHLLDTRKKRFIISKIWNFETLKIQNMFQIFKFSKMFYHIYMGYNVHDVLNKILVYNTWNWTLIYNEHVLVCFEIIIIFENET
jgi:hypothetical protein